MKHNHVYQQLCTCSTDSITDHNDTVVKFITFSKSTHRYPQYSKVIQENNAMRHFSSPKYLIGTQNVMMKNYSCQKPCDFLNKKIDSNQKYENKSNSTLNNSSKQTKGNQNIVFKEKPIKK